LFRDFGSKHDKQANTGTNDPDCRGSLRFFVFVETGKHQANKANTEGQPMRAKEMKKWSECLSELRGLSGIAYGNAPESEWRENIWNEYGEIVDLVVDTEETLVKGGRITPAMWVRMASAVSAFKVNSKLMMELPGMNARWIWDQAYPLIDVLEDASFELWVKAEQYDLGLSAEPRFLIHRPADLVRLLAELDQPKEKRSPITPDLRADVWDKSRGICWYCGGELHPFRNFHVDHILPVVDGGTNDLGNLVPCCQSCNTRKGPRPAEYLRRFIGSGVFWFEKDGRA
jgi:hypothetical protein